MSLASCLARAAAAGFTGPASAARATTIFNDLRDLYITQGFDPVMADAKAAQDTLAALKRKAGDERHQFLSHVATMRQAEAQVKNAVNLATVNTDLVEYWAPSKNAGSSLVGQTNGLRRLFHKRLSTLVTKHHRDLLGRSKDKAGLLNIARELHGKATGDASAKAIAAAVTDLFRDMRRMFNEAGGTIGDLADWGLPHTHDRISITKAGYARWSKEIEDRLAWDKIVDNLTGRPMAPPGQKPSRADTDRFLRSVYDSIAFGRDSDKPAYGRAKGSNLITQHGESRVLHFKDADDWIEYNKRFGSGDVYGSIIAHTHRMSEDIVALRNLGRSPELMVDYRTDLAIAEARKRGDEALADKIRENGEDAKRMLRLQRGGQQPISLRQAQVARFFSSVRAGLTAAFLERAIVASLSDTNSIRMAALSVGMNQASPIKRHMELLFSGTSREEALRMGWVADTLTDPGLILSRWQAEVPSAEIMERLSSGVMRAQGLAHWTDQGRTAFQQEMSGLFAVNAGRPLAAIDEPLQSLLRQKNVTDAEWADFTAPQNLYTAANGATFAPPIWWRETTTMAPDLADDLFLRLQGLVEEQTEFAVPTQNLWSRSRAETDLIPGTIWYEVAKSGLMFKSFAMTFTVNQIGRIMSLETNSARAAYAGNLIAGATVMGAVSLQILNMLNGRDAEEMDSPGFWSRAMLKGGGFGVMGDLLATGETAGGGGYADFFGGPGLQLLDDVRKLSVGNALEVMQGEDTRFGREFVRFLDTYSPATDLPVLGLAIDRFVWNGLQKILDPEAEANMAQAVGRRKRDYNQGSWWMPGTASPQRAPAVGLQPGPG